MRLACVAKFAAAEATVRFTCWLALLPGDCGDTIGRDICVVAVVNEVQ